MTDIEFIRKAVEVLKSLNVVVSICNVPETLHLGSYSYMNREQLVALAKAILELDGYEIEE